MVSDLNKNSYKLRTIAPSLESLSGNTKERKVMHMAQDDKLDEALFYGLHKREARECQLVDLFCVALHAKLNRDSAPEFKASRDWLWRFCKRHGLRQLSIQGEKHSSGVEAPDPFKKKLAKLIEDENLTRTCTIVMKLACALECYPPKTLAARSEKHASGMKKQKDRITAQIQREHINYH
jgi:hypothetical protein